MVFESNPRRDVWGTIAGFIFQVNTTIVRWLGLQDGEVLELERGEDIDIVQTEFGDGVVNVDRVLEQTKRRTSGVLTLKSPEKLRRLQTLPNIAVLTRACGCGFVISLLLPRELNVTGRMKAVALQRGKHYAAVS